MNKFFLITLISTNFVSPSFSSLISNAIELDKSDLNIEELARYMIIKAIETGFNNKGINIEAIRNSPYGFNIENKDLLNFVDDKTFKQTEIQTIISTFLKIFEPLCEFSCPSKRPIPRQGHMPSSNGCGSYGFNIQFSTFNLAPFDECCNTHDICYSTCLTGRNNCDTRFRQCLVGSCRTISKIRNWTNQITKACNVIGNLMYYLVRDFGCIAYKNSQVDACTC